MATLLLRLAGPLQSWGIEAKFETRRTLEFPTKSGVIGMLAAALGYSRDDPLDRLNALNFGVRVDKEGDLLCDYHTAESEKHTYVTRRFYLADAVFLAGFESDDRDFLEEIENALKNPAFPLYLGRRSCVPTMPLVIGIKDLSLIEALKNEAWLLSEWQQRNSRDESYSKLRIITDSEVPNPSSVLRDSPVSFSRKYRKFAMRYVQELDYVEQKLKESLESEHDVFSELRE